MSNDVQFRAVWRIAGSDEPQTYAKCVADCGAGRRESGRATWAFRHIAAGPHPGFYVAGPDGWRRLDDGGSTGEQDLQRQVLGIAIDHTGMLLTSSPGGLRLWPGGVSVPAPQQSAIFDRRVVAMDVAPTGGRYVLRSPGTIAIVTTEGALRAGLGWGVRDGSAEFQWCATDRRPGTPHGSALGQFDDPADLAIDPNGNMYVVDRGNARIQRFSRDDERDQLTWGWGVVDGADSFQICAAECMAGLRGDRAGQFDGAAGVGVDWRGRVFVADASNHRVQVFDARGDFLFTWGWGVSTGAERLETCNARCRSGVAGGGDGQLNRPEDVVVVDHERTAYVLDSGNRRIVSFALRGASR